MNSEPFMSGPYTHTHSSIPRTMMLVVLALLPATLFGWYQFGIPAILLFSVTVLSALLAEAMALKLAAKPVRLYLMDGSALLTAWLLAMSLPPWAPWWIGVLGAFIAIIIGKQVFGGIGQNLFNPAMVARVALLISFPLEMTLFTQPVALFSPQAPDLIESLSITFAGLGSFENAAASTASAWLDAHSGATVLGYLKTELGRGIELSEVANGVAPLWQSGWGSIGGSMGETSAILILLGGIFLLYKRIISWTIPVSMLASLGVLAAVFHLIDPESYVGPLTHLMTGGAILGAFFIATDLVTSPVSVRGQIVFGAGCGILTFAIRTWAGYPEGVAFAVMLMNACTPLIDHYMKPRIYGRDRKGQPLVYETEN